jgi:hypothetical protein
VLFAIRPALEPSRVFDGLNRLLREVMLAALEGRAVDPNVMPVGLHAAVDGNQACRDALTSLRAALAGLEQGQKDALRSALMLNTEVLSSLI